MPAHVRLLRASRKGDRDPLGFLHRWPMSDPCVNPVGFRPPSGGVSHFAELGEPYPIPARLSSDRDPLSGFPYWPA